VRIPVKDEEVKAAAEKLAAWVRSPEGKAALAKAAEKSRKAREAMMKQLQVPDSLMRMRVSCFCGYCTECHSRGWIRR
jgi:hypothetical protein